MEDCLYEELSREEKRSRKHFFRQMQISSGAWTHFFLVGQFLGAPTVYVPQLRREALAQKTELDEDLASWLYSVFGFAAVPWVFVLPVVLNKYGRKLPFLLSNMDMFLAYLIFYCSNNPIHILISEIVLGISYASAMTTSILIISEYTSPEYRGIFLTIKSASLFWGIWSANAIGTFLHYKHIAVIGFLGTLYNYSAISWPESPQWLATQGRFNDCKTAYRWLHGSNGTSEKELNKLIESQTENTENVNLFKSIRKREFYKPLFLCILLVTQYNFSGKFVCSIYATDVIKKMTGSDTTAYVGMLILDGVTIIGMYFGCYLSKIFKRRTLYLTSTMIGIIFLFIISLHSYLIKLEYFKENNIISMVLLTGFTVPISCGPMIMNTSIYAELIPLKYKSIIILITALFFYISITALLKIAPFIFKQLGMHGTFLFYGISAGVGAVLLYLYLPETKDKTLQEIEYSFKRKNDERKDLTVST